jgi:predicted acetyltransferase
MSIEIRTAHAEEMNQFGDLTAYAYGGAFGDGEDNLAMHANRPEWTLCAFDGPTMVASYATIPFTARANGNAVALGGVTTVATAPEYRRRGLLRSITSQALEAQLDAGQSVAALWASQAAIYQRYGYAAASAQISYQIDSVDLNLLEPASDEMRVMRGPLTDIMADIKTAYRSFVATRTLYLHRSAPLWQANVLTETAESGPVHGALCRDADDQVRGYVLYTLRNDLVTHRARNQALEIRDLVALDIDAYRALWAYLSRHDLVGRISWQRAPLDDPLPELLAEPRMLHAQAHEGVWLRIVDVAGAFTGRGYDCDGEIEFSVADDSLTPWNDGGYRLTVSNGIAEVQRIGVTDALTLSVKTLASAWCGRHRLSQLASWGLLQGDAATIERADRLFATRHSPHCPDHF